VDSKLPFKEQLFGMMRAFARRQATLSVNWLRVGYVQGNMNSDNCLVSGRTMDYGPFGFLERYESLWSPFTSDMERKFGFERQPLASQVRRTTSPQHRTYVHTHTHAATNTHTNASPTAPTPHPQHHSTNASPTAPQQQHHPIGSLTPCALLTYSSPSRRVLCDRST
jgi:hypothetical protein